MLSSHWAQPPPPPSYHSNILTSLCVFLLCVADMYRSYLRSLPIHWLEREKVVYCSGPNETTAIKCLASIIYIPFT
jgi:hypothetical protein